MTFRKIRRQLGDADLATQIDGHAAFVRLIIRGCLGVVAVYATLRGIAYLPPINSTDLPDAMRLITTVIPIWAYAILWLAAGLIAVYGAIRGLAEGTVGVVVASSAWAVGYTASWLGSFKVWPNGAWWQLWDWQASLGNRDYLTASHYWAICLLLIGGRYLAVWALRGLALARRLVEDL